MPPFATAALPETRGWEAAVHLPVGAMPGWMQGLVAVAMALLVLGPLVWLQMRGRGLRGNVETNIKLSHFLPASIQIVLFTYWAIYWRGLQWYAPGIAMQVVYAYVLDALLSLASRRKWVASVGPLPIVLSTNLFVIFLPGHAYLTLAAITVALCSRVFIRYTDLRGVRRHVLNPSAFGISVVGVATLLWPALGYGDTAYEFNIPPNMAELVLALGLIVQWKVPVVLLSLGCVGGIHFWAQFSGEYMFSPYWAPVTLVIVLLVTDPATTPRSAWGRLMYGFAVGLAMQLSGHVLRELYDLDNYAKVLGIPMANALVPLFERIAARLPRIGLIERRYNALHIAVWLGWMVSQMTGPVAKAPGLEQTYGARVVHATNRTPFIRFAPDGSLKCKDNPMFCKGFSFADEAQAWIERP